MPNMKLLLQESITHVGKVGDVVEVSPGYARNYLRPQGLAVQPTPGNIKKIEARRKGKSKPRKKPCTCRATCGDHRQAQRCRSDPRSVAPNEQGHLYGGAVSATDIAKATVGPGLQRAGRRCLQLPGKLDRIEKYTVVVAFAEDLKTEIKVWVAPDAESKSAIDAHQKAAASRPRPRQAISERSV